MCLDFHSPRNLLAKHKAKSVIWYKPLTGHDWHVAEMEGLQIKPVVGVARVVQKK